MKLCCKKLHEDAKLPVRAHTTDLGYDLFSIEDKTLEPGERYGFRLGFAAELPSNLFIECTDDNIGFHNYFTTGAFVWDKSGVGGKGVKVLGGVIEATYRGEWVAMLINLSDKPISFAKHQKLCQVVIMPVFLGSSEWVDELNDTERGTGGFGSTGA